MKDCIELVFSLFFVNKGSQYNIGENQGKEKVY